MEVFSTTTKKTRGKKKHSLFEPPPLLHALGAEQQGNAPTRDLLPPLRDQRQYAPPGALGVWLGGFLLLEGGAVSVFLAAASSSPIDDGALLRGRIVAVSDLFFVSSAAREDVEQFPEQLHEEPGSPHAPCGGRSGARENRCRFVKLADRLFSTSSTCCSARCPEAHRRADRQADHPRYVEVNALLHVFFYSSKPE